MHSCTSFVMCSINDKPAAKYDCQQTNKSSGRCSAYERSWLASPQKTVTFSSAILTFFYKSTIFFARFSLLLLWSNSWTVVSAQLSEYTTDAMFNIQFSYDAMRLFLLKIRLAAEIFSDSEVVQCRQPSSRKVD